MLSPGHRIPPSCVLRYAEHHLSVCTRANTKINLDRAAILPNMRAEGWETLERCYLTRHWHTLQGKNSTFKTLLNRATCTKINVKMSIFQTDQHGKLNIKLLLEGMLNNIKQVNLYSLMDRKLYMFSIHTWACVKRTLRFRRCVSGNCMGLVSATLHVDNADMLPMFILAVADEPISRDTVTTTTKTSVVVQTSSTHIHTIRCV